MSVTVIFGGTFNPFHLGHYEMLSCLNRLPEVGKILVMPDRIPPHKTCDFLAEDNDRIEMCRIAAADFDKAQVSLTEFERTGKSYTYDTVLRLKSAYPGTRFFMACGGDMIATLDTWHEWQKLIAEIGFYAFRRQGTADFDESVRRMRNFGAEIRIVDAPVTAVSSTQLREELKRGEESVLIPQKVYNYIKKRKIYNGYDDTGIQRI